MLLLFAHTIISYFTITNQKLHIVKILKNLNLWMEASCLS